MLAKMLWLSKWGDNLSESLMIHDATIIPEREESALEKCKHCHLTQVI